MLNILHSCERNHWCVTTAVSDYYNDVAHIENGVCSACGEVPPEALVLASKLEIQCCWPPMSGDLNGTE